MLYNRCTGNCKFGNNTYPWRIRRRSNLGHIFQEIKLRLNGLGNTVLSVNDIMSLKISLIFITANLLKNVKQ
jgi:hypothetical protein